MGKGLIAPALWKQIFVRLLAGIGLVLWVVFFILPQSRMSAQARLEILAIQQKLAGVREDLKRLPAMKDELTRLTTEGVFSSVSRPPEEQLPELLGSIAQMARTSQVRLLAVKPKMELNALTPGPSGYLEMPLYLEAAAGYHQIGAFLDLLENSQHLVRLDEFNIKSDDTDPWRHRAVFTLRAYLFPKEMKGAGASK